MQEKKCSKFLILKEKTGSMKAQHNTKHRIEVVIMTLII